MAGRTKTSLKMAIEINTILHILIPEYSPYFSIGLTFTYKLSSKTHICINKLFIKF